ncbi:MAG TPA: transglycosylase SLT domain-containing protein [Burkholderiales bacterium]|nr:transglycosylase SLT domain-containing protein [Burkholderiales bacterium]
MTTKLALLAGLLALLCTSPLRAIELPPLNPQDPSQDGAAAENALDYIAPLETAGPVAPVPDAAPAETAIIPADSLWARIRAGFAMPEVDSPLVARHEAWYLNRPDYVQRIVERSRLYLYFIVEEVEKRNMPMEIALLPMIESAYNPTAYSRAHAAGIWQFIPSTGKRYGLQQNWWYDGRRDVVTATRAALDYLERLHDQFGDWQLALAAYNWGENGVARAVARNKARRKPANYMSLKMPRETRNYLPKLQAVKNIISHPDKLGFPLDEIPNSPYFTTVTTPQHIDMQVAARLADMSEDDFRSLNPAHNRPVITSNGSRTLLVPIEKAALFQANLKGYDEPLVSWQTYTLKKNETLATVAAKFEIGQDRLREINGISRHTPVKPGRSLLVPMDEDADASNFGDTWNTPEFQPPEDRYGGRLSYRVRSGDSLYSIARKHRVTVAAIKDWNKLRSNQIRAGQRLTIYTSTRHTALR